MASNISIAVHMVLAVAHVAFVYVPLVLRRYALTLLTRTPVFNLRLLIFSIAPFVWLPSSRTLTRTYAIISYGNIIFLLTPF